MSLKRLWATSVFAAASCVVMAGWAAAQEEPAAAPGTLDGKTFVGEVGVDGKRNGESGTFEFRDGSFAAPGFHRQGFAAAPYTADQDGDTVIFQAELLNAKDEKMRWSGTVREGQIEGVMTWYTRKKGPIKYWFRGSLPDRGLP